ncbi:MAG TPA: Na/Pi cotransporter family protein [Candidatus Marinimicrobia bacterium]|nr:Na/Pi cotransporter family protein [Candidatus Neomarinimicrobiota bacterium]HIN46492.1 Na/Pi cotransporter family protein [Candidatus Neomarinimicrobiota bacterium]
MSSMSTARVVLLLTFLLMSPLMAGGNEVTSSTISWGLLIMNLLGGLALFLYGMSKMSDGMKKAAGNRMRNILAALTKNRVIALIVGAFVTMIIQSSSATTVMLVSFVQAQLMSYAQALGVIMGANIGTTITAQLVAFKLTDYALGMITVGFIMTMFSKRETFKHFGEALLGFGILFFGMYLMSDAMKPLRDYQPFQDLMIGLENPWFGLLIGALFTGLIQSSSAFTGIVITLAMNGLITLEAGIPLILGANVGTCITAGLASIGTIRDAKRVAIAHVLFNIGGVLIFIWFIPYLADFVRTLSSDTPRQIANAHTIFNITVGIVFLPFTTLLAKLVYKILPDKEIEKGVIPTTWHLDNSQISHPAIAIGLVQSELSRMTKIVARMLRAIIHPFTTDDPGEDEIYLKLSILEGIDMREDKIDFLDEKVVNYLLQIGRQELSNQQMSEVYAMISIANDLESIGDVIHRDMLPLVEKRRQLDSDFSEEGKKELKAYHVKMSKQMSRLQDALSEMDPTMAKKILRKEEKYVILESDFRIRHVKRLRDEMEESLETHEVHVEFLDLLKQVSVHLANIAKTIMEIESSEGENEKDI